MRLADLRPKVIDGVALWFDCPQHGQRPRAEEFDETVKCRGRMACTLKPSILGDRRGPANGWTWSGDWSTWNVTLYPSLQSGVCGCHVNIIGGEVQVTP